MECDSSPNYPAHLETEKTSKIENRTCTVYMYKGSKFTLRRGTAWRGWSVRQTRSVATPPLMILSLVSRVNSWSTCVSVGVSGVCVCVCVVCECGVCVGVEECLPRIYQLQL